MRVEHFFALDSVESFDERLLVVLSKLETVDPDPLIAALSGKDIGGHLQPAGDSYPQGTPPHAFYRSRVWTAYNENEIENEIRSEGARCRIRIA